MRASSIMKSIKNIDLNLLKALDALLDERSVTRAAARLGLTQPAMSGILTRLRESFGDPLFVRAQRGILPTKRAHDLIVPVKQILAEIDALLQPPIFNPAVAKMTFTIAATDYALRAIAVPFLSELKKSAPHIRVCLLPLDHSQVESQLERGFIDVALMTPEITPQNLHARELFKEKYVCVFRKGHPTITANSLNVDQFCNSDHALVSYNGGSFNGIADEVLQKNGKQRNVTLSVKNFLILPEILRTSDMVATLPSRLVNGMNDLVITEPPIDIPGFTKTVVWHERTHHDPAQRWLRELLFISSCDRS